MSQTRESFLLVKLVCHSRWSNSSVIVVSQTCGLFSLVKLLGQTLGLNFWVEFVAHFKLHLGSLKSVLLFQDFKRYNKPFREVSL